MAKLEKLSPKQIKLMSQVRDEWINIALHKGPDIDKEECEAGVKWLYYSASLKEPEVVFVDGPKDFAEKLGVKASVWASVWASVRASVGDSVCDSVWASVRASVGDSVGASVWDSVGASVCDSVWASVCDSVRASVRASVGDSVSWCSLSYDSDWAAFYDFYNKIEIVDQEKANKYIGFLKTGAFYTLFFEKKAFVFSRPVRVEQDERKRLHSIIGPALSFKDGTEIYKINGVLFEKELWAKIVKGEILAKEVFAIENMEQRRIAYELMDKRKMLELPDLKVLDLVVDDGYGTPMKVISFKVKEFDKPFMFLNCFCPSTGREYFLQTDKETCADAKMGSFGFTGDIKFNSEY